MIVVGGVYTIVTSVLTVTNSEVWFPLLAQNKLRATTFRRRGGTPDARTMGERRGRGRGRRSRAQCVQQRQEQGERDFAGEQRRRRDRQGRGLLVVDRPG